MPLNPKPQAHGKRKIQAGVSTGSSVSSLNLDGTTLQLNQTNSQPQRTVSLNSLSGTPAGNNTELQFNNNGSFGGIDDLKWDGDKLLLGDNTDTGNYLLVEGSDSENTYNILEGKRRYPRIRLTDTSSNKTQDIWLLSTQLRFGSNASNSSNAAMIVHSGSAGNTTFNGNVGIGTSAPNERFEVAPNTDVNAIIGNAVIGYNFSDYASFSHYDQRANTGGYALLQKDDGTTYLNAKSSMPINFRIENSTKFMVDGNHFRSDQTNGASMRNEAPSSTNPVFTFNNDVDTGMGRAAANELSLITAGTEAIRVDSSQNVGIGTTSPNGKMTVQGDLDIPRGSRFRAGSNDGNQGVDIYHNNDGSSAFNGNVVFEGRQSGGDVVFRNLDHGQGYQFHAENSSGTEQLIMYMDGANKRVGIGTDSPDVLFDVSGAAVIQSLRINANDGDRMRLFRRAENEMVISSESASLYLNSSYNGIYFENASSAVKMRMTNDGDFGIGTTSPGSKLDIVSTSNDNTGGIRIGDGSTFAAIYHDSSENLIIDPVSDFIVTGSDDVRIQSSDDFELLADDFYFKNDADNSTMMRITSAGNVGIGTGSPLGSIHIDGGAYQQVFTRGSHNHTIVKGNSDDTLTFATGAPDSHTARFKIKPTGIDVVNDAIITGSVGIGTNAPGAQLDIHQTADDTALEIAGYDDKSGVTAKLHVRSNGLSRFQGSTDAQVQSVAGSIYLSSSEHMYLDVGTRNTYSHIFRDDTGEFARFRNAALCIGATATANGAPLHVVEDGTNNLVANFLSADGIAEIRIGDNSKYTRLLTVGSQYKIMPGDGEEMFVLDAAAYRTTLLGESGGNSPKLTFDNPDASNDIQLTQGDAGWFGLSTDGGSTQHFIARTGNIGIRTESPASPLDVKSLSTDSTPFRVTRSANANLLAQVYEDSSGDGTFALYDDAQNGDIILRTGGNTVFNNNGDFGIGTTSPSKKLEVVGHISASSSTATDAIYFSNGNAMMYNNNTHHFFYGGDTSTRWIANDGSSTFMSLMNSGKLGIGDTNPTRHLTVNSAGIDIVSLFKSTSNRATIQLSDDDTNRYINTENSAISLGPNSSLHSNNLNIVGSPADIGIGTTSPSYTVDVVRNEADHNYVAVTNTSAGTSSVAGFRAHSQTADLFLLGNADNRTTTKFGITQGGYSQITTANGNGLLFGNTQSAPIIFGTNDTERMRITSAGNVGIGTASPNSLLEIVGTNPKIIVDGGGSDDASIELRESASYGGRMYYDGDNNIFMKFTTIDAGTEKIRMAYDRDGNVYLGSADGSDATPNPNMFIAEGGNVGIGTNTPSQDLHVVGNGLFTGGLTVGDSAADTFITRGHTHLATLGNNVGIGTTSPDAKLDIRGDGTLLTLSGSANAIMKVFSNTEDASIDIYAGADGNVETGYVQFYDDNTKKWFIGKDTGNDFLIYDVTRGAAAIEAKDNSDLLLMQGGGNVGIGTSTPGSLLDVRGTVNLQSGHNEGIIIGAENNSTARNDNTVKVARVGMPQYDIDDGNFCLLHPSVTQYDNYIRYGGGTSAMDAATQHIWYTATSVDTSDGTERMRILSDGKIGIGTTSPNQKLEVAGNITTTALDSEYRFGNRSDLLIRGHSDFDMELISPQDMAFSIDSDNNETAHKFLFKTNTTTPRSAGTTLMEISEAGDVSITGGLGVTGSTLAVQKEMKNDVSGDFTLSTSYSHYKVAALTGDAPTNITVTLTAPSSPRIGDEYTIVTECGDSPAANPGFANQYTATVRIIANTGQTINMVNTNINIDSRQSATLKYKMAKLICIDTDAFALTISDVGPIS